MSDVSDVSDVFELGTEAGDFLVDAALDAGYELGVFDAVAGGSRTFDELAAGLASRRLRALVDVLALVGALVREGDRFARGHVPPRKDAAHRDATTTNPAGVTGDGLALAVRAGAELRDVEFVQFHPTVLLRDSARGQCPLITEALRGAGAVVVDAAACRSSPAATRSATSPPGMLWRRPCSSGWNRETARATICGWTPPRWAAPCWNGISLP